MIRDMALWIANEIEKDTENFLVLTGVQKTEAPNFEKWGRYKRISLMESGIQSLPEVPNCPRLQTLLLEHNRIEEITDGFFQSLPSLRVLSLRGNDSLTELPLGILSLVSLHHLDLSRTSLRGLPEELKALENLRNLNLEETSEMSRIPKQLISSFSKLRVLRMLKCRGVLSGDEEPLMKDLLCLEHLNVISLTLDGSKANVIPILFKYQKLVSITQSLDIIFCADPGLNALSLANLSSMEELEELNISWCIFEEFKSTGEVKKVLQSGFRSLRKVGIEMCGANDLTGLVFVPNLQQLEIAFCSDMEEIISGKKFSEGSETMGEPNLFAQLESLIIFGLKNLKSICWTPLTLPKLKEIQVFQCRQLKKRPLKSSNVKERQIVIVGQKEWWEELEWGDEATKNSFSTCFVPA